VEAGTGGAWRRKSARSELHRPVTQTDATELQPRRHIERGGWSSSPTTARWSCVVEVEAGAIAGAWRRRSARLEIQPLWWHGGMRREEAGGGELGRERRRARERAAGSGEDRGEEGGGIRRKEAGKGEVRRKIRVSYLFV
jgi:hypothetical protein